MKNRFKKLAGGLKDKLEKGAEVAMEKGSQALEKSKELGADALEKGKDLAEKGKEFAGETFDKLDEKYKKFKTDETHVIVKFRDCWADEFDCDGFMVMSKGEYATNYLKPIAEQFKENGSFEYGFGTNETLEYEAFDDFMNCLEIVEISEKHAEIIKSYFGGDYGIIPKL